VQPLPVVEHLHVLEHCRPGFRAGAEADVVDLRAVRFYDLGTP
jgi:hypothetical protein